MGKEGGRRRGKVQGIRSINGRYKIDRSRLRMVWEMEKPKNFYVQPTDMNLGAGVMLEREGCRAEAGA